MAFRSGTHGLIVLVLAAMPVVTNAAPVPFDGRFYEFVAAPGISWTAANAAANALTHGGLPGHLATISTAAENDFIKSLVDANFVPSGNRDEGWIGGSEQAGPVWKWVNNGTIPLPTAPPAAGYRNWLPGEPADASGPDETFLAFGRGGSDQWGSQDGSSSTIGYYVVEYGDNFVRRAGGDCAHDDPTGPGCILGVVNGQQITIPKNFADLVGTEYTITTELIENDAARCGTELQYNTEVTFGKFICGAPDLLVAHVQSTGATAIDIRTGVVDVLVEDGVLPNPSYECVADPSANDPTQAAVLGFQSGVRALEKIFPYPTTPNTPSEFFKGNNSVFEDTFECGSGKGRTSGTGSWYIAGAQVWLDWSNLPNQQAKKQRAIEWLKYKLFYISKATDDACQATSKGDCNNFKTQVKNITADLNKANVTEALAHARNFERSVQSAKFNEVAGRNNFGELESRILNFIFTTQNYGLFIQ